MPESRDNIDLVLAADDNYARHLGVTLASVIYNYHGSRRLSFHIFADNISFENKELLRKVGKKEGTDLIFYDISDDLLADCPEVNHLSRTSYARLLAPELLPPDVHKAIYLDCDIVVLGDIAGLYDQNLSGYPLGAVTDVMAKEILRIYFYPGLSNYFNAGILLIDLDAWRRGNVKDRAWKFIAEYFSELIRSDQDVLNCLFKNDWKALDNRFNVDLKRKSFRALPGPDTVILHYSDRIKPDNYLFSGRSGHYYFDYLEKTPWHDFKIRKGSLKDLEKRYRLLLTKEAKRLLLPCLPASLLDSYRRLLWRTYKVKKKGGSRQGVK